MDKGDISHPASVVQLIGVWLMLSTVTASFPTPQRKRPGDSLFKVRPMQCHREARQAPVESQRWSTRGLSNDGMFLVYAEFVGTVTAQR